MKLNIKLLTDVTSVPGHSEAVAKNPRGAARS